MKPIDVKSHIEQAARSFDAELHTPSYARTHADDAQLKRLLSFLSPRPEQLILDLGTGAGYVATALANMVPTCEVVGLDIAEGAIEQDRINAERQALTNVVFRVFDGVALPFPDDTFDACVCRYAFHHFPRPDETLRGLARAIRRGGKLVLADAVKSEADETDFINAFQHLKRDGHVRIHCRTRLVDLVSRHGFELADIFESSITFTRDRSEEYDALLASTPGRVLDSYKLTVGERQMHLSLEILNAVFVNRHGS